MKTPFVVVTSVLLLAAMQAQARDWGRSTTVRTQRGTATRTVDGSAANGSLTRSATTTSASGKTVQANQQIQRTADGRTISTSVTGPQGKSVTTSGSVTHADGTRTATRSVTGPEGNTKSVTTTTTR